MTDDIIIVIEGQQEKSFSLNAQPTEIGEELSNLFGLNQWSQEKVCNVITQLAQAYQEIITQLKQQIENINRIDDSKLDDWDRYVG